jgi:hypothetical protein
VITEEIMPVTPTERAARITYLLTSVGIAMTTAEVAQVAGVTPRHALRMLDAICRMAPIYCDGDIWRMLRRRT